MIRYGFTIIIFFLLSITSLLAQKFVSLPFSGYDEDAVVQIGFQYNYINQSYQIKLKDNWKQLFDELDDDPQDLTYLDGLRSIRNKEAHGFSIGIPVDVKWNDKLSINFTPSFNILNSNSIEYASMNPEINALTRKTKHILSDVQGDNFNSFEFPVVLKFLSEEKKNFKSDTKYRGYILGGVRLTRWTGIISNYNQQSTEKINNRPHTEVLVLKPEYMSWEAGFGFDIFMSYFKVSPEVRFSQSIHNVLSNNHFLSKANKFMAPIDRGLIRNIYFSLIFQ